MRPTRLLFAVILAPGLVAAQGNESLPRLTSAALDDAPWNVQSGGIAAYDVSIDAAGSVTKADLVQDVAPYGAMLAQAVPSWRFEAARRNGQAVASRVLVIGFFRPPALNFPAPERPRYKETAAPPELAWPTSVVVPPYPPNALGSGKVLLEVDISDKGRVVGVRQVSPRTAFDSAAADTARQWVFRPAQRGNREVESRAFLIFSFVGTT